jgi:S-adenosylmethionine hydrolase
MPTTAPRITLLTDFGTADGYVAAMKGIIAAIAPDVIVDDVAHDIARGDVRAAAWALTAYWRHYPAGTIHVVVVDPGVGSTRHALVVKTDDRFLVAPDNGVLTYALAEASNVRTLAIERYMSEVISATFHGRDVFAPVAAHLARGIELDEVGRVIDNVVRLEIPQPLRNGSIITGEVVHVDHFGNLITNIPATWLDQERVARIGESAVPILRAYSDVESGAALALIGSRGLLEISVRDGRADDVLRVRVATEVTASQ